MLRVVEDAAAREELAAGLDEIVREGARRMLAAALAVEVEAYIVAYTDQRDEAGHRLVVRNGHARPRQVMTAAGAVTPVADLQALLPSPLPNRVQLGGATPLPLGSPPSRGFGPIGSRRGRGPPAAAVPPASGDRGLRPSSSRIPRSSRLPARDEATNDLLSSTTQATLP